MKFNMVAHMTAPKESTRKRFRNLDILPRLVCLLLALILWLVIVNVSDSEKKQNDPDKSSVESVI